MANRTAKDARDIHGKDPQLLVETIIRTRIHDSLYWKEHCFALNPATVPEKAVELTHIGGVTSDTIRPTPFLCIVLKMLQIQVAKDIVLEYVAQSDFKYLRCVGALYLRLTGSSVECYKYLEPHLSDYRKIKSMTRTGDFVITHVDEFIDELLHDDRVCDIALPRIATRYQLELTKELEPRVSTIEEELEAELRLEDEKRQAEQQEQAAKEAAAQPPAAEPNGSSLDQPVKAEAEDSPEAGDSAARRRPRSPSPPRRGEEEAEPDSDSERRERAIDDGGNRSHRQRSPLPSDSRPSRAAGAGVEGSRSTGERRPAPKGSHKLVFKKTAGGGAAAGDDGQKSSGQKEQPKAMSEEDEIAQANALRAKLGLKPLKA